MNAALEQLRRVAEALPPGASVLLPREALLEALGDGPRQTDDSPEVADLTIEQVARRFGRSRSTIRGWITTGKLAGAYRFRAREWRVPPAALLAFEEAERRGRPQGGPSGRKGETLSDWRTVTRDARIERGRS